MIKKQFIILILLVHIVSYSATFEVNNIAELRQTLIDVADLDENCTIILNKGTYDLSSDNLGELVVYNNKYDNYTNKAYVISGVNDANNTILDAKGLSRVINSTISTIYLKNLTIKNGYINNEKGAGVKAIVTDIDNVIFDSNKAVGSSAEGGALYAITAPNISNSIFKNNSIINEGGSGGYGAGIYVETIYKITNCIFKNNKNTGYYAGTGLGGAIYIDSTYDNSVLLDSNLFANNEATCQFSSDSEYSYCGAGADIYKQQTGTLVAINNIFKNSKTTNSLGVSVRNLHYSYGSDTEMIFINNTFENIKGTDIAFSTKSLFVNNKFDSGKTLYSDTETKSYLHNNIIDISKIDLNKFVHDNSNYKIGHSVQNVGILYESDIIKDYLSGKSSTIKNFISNSMNFDYNNKPRMSLDNAIDIGAFETSNSKLYISNFNVNNNKIFLKTFFSFTVNSDNNSKYNIFIDFGDTNNSNFIKIKNIDNIFHTYTKIGKYSVKIKLLLDNEEEILNEYPIIIYNLTTDEAIEYGKKLCQDNPTACNISSQNILSNSKLTNNLNGWKLLGTNQDITSEDIFNINSNISIIWVYRNGQWMAKSSSDEINDIIINNQNITILNNIENGDGFWIYIK